MNHDCASSTDSSRKIKSNKKYKRSNVYTCLSVSEELLVANP